MPTDTDLLRGLPAHRHTPPAPLHGGPTEGTLGGERRAGVGKAGCHSPDRPRRPCHGRGEGAGRSPSGREAPTGPFTDRHAHRRPAESLVLGTVPNQRVAAASPDAPSASAPRFSYESQRSRGSAVSKSTLTPRSLRKCSQPAGGGAVSRARAQAPVDDGAAPGQPAHVRTNPPGLCRRKAAGPPVHGQARLLGSRLWGAEPGGRHLTPECMRGGRSHAGISGGDEP